MPQQAVCWKNYCLRGAALKQHLDIVQRDIVIATELLQINSKLGFVQQFCQRSWWFIVFRCKLQQPRFAVATATGYVSVNHISPCKGFRCGRIPNNEAIAIAGLQWFMAANLKIPCHRVETANTDQVMGTAMVEMVLGTWSKRSVLLQWRDPAIKADYGMQHIRLYQPAAPLHQVM